jgi:hypothetical protein
MAERRRRWSRLLLACLLAMAAFAAPATSATSAALAADGGQQVAYGNDPLSLDAYQWRVANNQFDPYRNVATFYVDATGAQLDGLGRIKTNPLLSYDVIDVGELRTTNPDLYRALNPGSAVTRILRITSFNDPGASHSEQAIDFTLKQLKLDIGGGSGRLLAAFSERQPCPTCSSITANAKLLRWSRAYGRPPAGVSYANQKARDRAIAEVNNQATLDIAGDIYRMRRPLFSPPAAGAACGQASQPQAVQPPDMVLAAAVDCGPDPGGVDAEAGALERELARPEAPGGIDFSSLELRYVADTSGPGGPGLNYGFVAPATTGAANRGAGLDAARQASDSFFVWLELQPSRFTVNLNPTEPDRIVDAQLGRTDVGRILLEADFAMKKTVARLIHPDTPLGAQFWQQLQAGPDGGTCLSMRQWIVPAPATVHEVGDQLYILDAPLSVQLETDYLKGPGSEGAATCPGQDQAIGQHNEAVFRSMILPLVQQSVNQAPEYAALRRVYLTRVAAEWYRQRSAKRHTAYGSLIDRGNIAPWVSHQSWSPKTIFDQYVQSYRNGEFNVTHQTRQGNVIETRTYVFGGVDFTKIPELRLSGGQFDARAPGLQGRVQRSFDQPVADADGKRYWLGGTTVVHPRSPAASRPFPVAVPVLAVGFLVVVIAVSWLIARGIRPRRAAR